VSIAVKAPSKRAIHIRAARKRLKGTWRSDRERTISNWVFPKLLAASKMKFFESIFGKNTWRFTDRMCYGRFEDQKWRAHYELLWADEWSAVVLFKFPQNEKHFDLLFPDKESCRHLFFSDNHFYFVAGRAGNAEYFRRLKGIKSRGSRKPAQ
jgi:hypothetical protein